MNKLDIKLEKYIINRYISMPKLFDSLGIDYRINANMFCPFHHNENTPSAHLYADNNGYRLWCFSEYKMYGAWNIYKTYLPKINTNKLAQEIFNKMTLEQQKKLLNDIGIEEDLNEIPYKQALINFKSNKINILELLAEISNSYVDEA